MGTLPGLELCVLQTAKVLDSLAAPGRALASHHLATQSFPHVDSQHLRVEGPCVAAAPGGGGGAGFPAKAEWTVGTHCAEPSWTSCCREGDGLSFLFSELC